MAKRVAFFREYQRTHSWLTFTANLRDADISLWMLLGEARSKCAHVAGVPLQPALARYLNAVYLAKGAHATTAIEGNTLSEEEVRERIEGGDLDVPESRDYLKREVDNVLKAFNSIREQTATDGANKKITTAQILEWHRLVMDGVAEDGVVPGKIRTHSVGVGGYRGAPAEDCEFLLDRMCEWLSEEDFYREKLGVAADIVRAVLAHLYIAWIHPFGDGNGRTARLVEFYILFNAGIPDIAAHLLSDFYNRTRPKYYAQLKAASESGGKVVSMLHYAVSGFVDGLSEQIDLIRGHQWDIAWRDYVNEYFEDKRHSEKYRRQRFLVLDLSIQPEPVPRGKLMEISPRVAALYATKTPRVLTNDLAELRVSGLVVRAPAGGYQANRRLILAFVPLSMPPEIKGEARV